MSFIDLKIGSSRLTIKSKGSNMLMVIILHSYKSMSHGSNTDSVTNGVKTIISKEEL